jgi:hypothetical protein
MTPHMTPPTASSVAPPPPIVLSQEEAYCIYRALVLADFENPDAESNPCVKEALKTMENRLPRDFCRGSVDW